MNKEEFSTRIQAMEGTLYGVARTYLPGPADCADAVQEAVLKAYGSLGSLRREECLETWVVRILINQCKSLLRKQKRTVLMAQVPDCAAPSGADPALYEAVYSLDLRYRAPFTLYHLEGYSVAEIAGMLRLPQGTVTSRLQRARRILRHALGGDWE